jgi:L-lactate dehydrogenase complex protein LldF
MSRSAAQFKTQANEKARDLRHRQVIRTALHGYEIVRDKCKDSFQSWESARQAAAEIKWEAVNHLDTHLEALVAKLEARGTKVHWASTGAQACEIIAQILRDKNAHLMIKSKSMTSEEIHLNDALEKAGFTVVESDLGEFIMQLRHEPPYHIVFPSMNLTRGEIKDLFQRELGDAPSDSPEELTMVARRFLRKKYIAADVGLTGANFAIAETGMLSITENEGNSRLTSALPKTMITLIGIEKVLPRMADLALFLPMLATAGAGQMMTGYNTMYSGPRQPGEADGPEEWHVVLLDNRRTELLADAEQRDSLHCIRCGSCLNVCPVFRNIGGHSYGTTYPGPIGAVITPHLLGLKEWKHLCNASSLCEACTEACPVKIDLHHHLLQNRRNAALALPAHCEQLAYKIFGIIANEPKFWWLAKKIGWLTQPLHRLVNGSVLDPVRPFWTKTRDLAPMPRESFKDWWKKRKSN